jgi:rod shape-determining protein MreD
MKQLSFALFVFTAFVFQAGLRVPLSIGGVEPDFLALAVVTAAYTLNAWAAVFWAAVAGLLSDGLTSEPLGIGMLIAIITCCVVPQANRERSPRSITSMNLWCFAVVFTIVFATAAVRHMTAGRAGELALLLQGTAGTAAYSTLIATGVLATWRLLLFLFQGTEAGDGLRYPHRWRILNG